MPDADLAGRRALRILRANAAGICIAACAALLATLFAMAVLRRTSFGLPLEDGYIYLTYAKQFGRGEPFTYFPGGGYSAGSTSVLWPMLLAPFWTLGARGHALVWVSFLLSTALLAVTCIQCHRIVRSIFGTLAGVIAAVLVLAIAPFVWTSLSGMEVAFASALLMSAIHQLMAIGEEGAPGKKLGITLAALALSRPEATLIVGAVCSILALARARRRDWRAAAWWLAPLAAPLAWVTANKLFAGHWFPNTGVAKSHFYLPGFDWTYWWHAVTSQSVAMLRGLFWSPTSPFVWPRLIALLWLVGAVRIARWAWRNQRVLVGVLLVLSPFALILAVIATSGAWTFHNYRYISPAFPLVMLTAACGLAGFAPRRGSAWQLRAAQAWRFATLLVVALFARAAVRPMQADIDLYAQTVVDLNRQVVTIGRYLHRELPDAYVMFHDAGAVSYYGDTRVYDMLGLVTNHQAEVANNGPGSRFEFLESLPPAARPTHFAYYPGWMGQSHFFGEVLLRTPLGPAFHKRRLIGSYDMQLIAAKWDEVHTAEQPLDIEPGWAVVDRVDVADIASESQHHWSGQLGRRRFGDPTARWSLFEEDHRGEQMLLDGGRTIRGGSETFIVTVDPAKPVRVVMRTGGKPAYRWHETITRPVDIALVAADHSELGRATLPAPAGPFTEVTFELPPPQARDLVLQTAASSPYRVFHWFVLQPR